MSDIYDGKNEGKTEAEYEGFYKTLRLNVLAWAAKHAGSGLVELILNVPDFFYLLFKLAGDPDVPEKSRAQLILALAYFLSPIDVIPDFLGGVGWLDDLYVALLAVNSLMSSVGPEVVERHWLGEGELILKIRDTLARVDDRLGAKAIKRIIARYRSGGGAG